tara:strand:- start:92 stop:331 length:240 start_codon:yes stop_codon:yes gene_type:complete
MKYLLKLSVIIILWPCILWLVGCSLISFVSWNNYFIVHISDWDGVVRLFYICVSLICVAVLKPESTIDSAKSELANKGE